LDRRTVLELSDLSPRALIRLLGDIYNENYNQNELDSFPSNSISKGFINFCSKYDYGSQNPSKTGKGSDLVHWINRILRIRKEKFTIEDVNYTFTQRANMSLKHIETMQKLNLIKESYDRTSNDDAIYEVIDPK
jgi:hypothetical protein